ncbi:MAG: TIGR02677 family protein [Bacillota bacterium]
MRPTRQRLLTEPVDETRYLTAGNAVPRYRIIMRYFFEQHRLHQYTLTPAQVRKHVETILQRDYPEEECQQDLNSLKEWGNLEPDWELGLAGVKTIEDFKRRNVVYAATPDAIAIEQLLFELERRGEQVGELDGSAIARLWTHLLTFQTALQTGDPDQLRQSWDDLWRLFAEMADSANDYLGDMRRQEKERLLDLAAFQIYKAALVTYLTRFIEGLTAHRDRFRTLTQDWPVETIAVRLAEAARATTRQFESDDFLREDYRHQVESFQRWFAPGGSADLLHGFASRAINRVLRSAQRLSESRQGALSRAQDLLALADRFHGLRHDLPRTERLAALTFGLATPRHWQFELPEQASDNPDASPWLSLPHNTPIRQRRSYTQRQSAPSPVADLALKKAVLRQRDRERREAAAAMVDRLFAGGSLALAEAPELSPDERDQILSWVYECLANSPACATRAEDGSLLRIRDPHIREHVWLRSDDGRMLVPAFTMERQREEG